MKGFYILSLFVSKGQVLIPFPWGPSMHSETTPWRAFHRSRLAVMASNDLSGEVAVLSPPSAGPGKLVDHIAHFQQGDLNKKLLDVGLAYEPTQCTPEVCQLIKEELTFRPVKTFEEENQYQYIFDVDGNSWSARFKRLLTTGSCILKTTLYPECMPSNQSSWTILHAEICSVL